MRIFLPRMSYSKHSSRLLYFSNFHPFPVKHVLCLTRKSPPGATFSFFTLFLNCLYPILSYSTANKLIPMAVGATVGGIAFSIVGPILSITLFCKTRKRIKANRDKIWVAQRETSNWRKDCEDTGFENR